MTSDAPPASPTHPAESSMRRDVASAYLATGAKIGSWVVVSGLLYRIDLAGFAMLALVRGTIGILNYTTLGLSPAMIRMIAEAGRTAPAAAEQGLEYFDPAATVPEDPVASHAAPASLAARSPGAELAVRRLYANGQAIALVSGIVGLAVCVAYAAAFNHLYQIPPHLLAQMPAVVLWMGVGTVLRLTSDAPGSVLQAHAAIARDNLRVAEAEAAWVVLSLALAPWSARVGWPALVSVAVCYALSGAVLFVRRSLFARRLTGLVLPRRGLVEPAVLKRLLAFGSLVLFAQLADYLYAPTDYILINKLLGWEQVAVYTPAMQIDSGLLLLVTGLSSVILPRTALAHTAGETARVRRYYVYGTLFSGALLALAAAAVWILSGLVFRLWLGNPMRATQSILPLVLVHTVLGGSSAVGRSILLGMGRVRPFTIAVLIAGASNVVLSYVFVRHLHLGLGGIVLGTIVAVVGRCAVWMPWYVLRTLRKTGDVGESRQT